MVADVHRAHSLLVTGATGFVGRFLCSRLLAEGWNGPGVKANFLNMMKVVHRRIPLPLASINNKRSLIYIGNLVDALATCATHPGAAGQTFLVSDGEDVSTPELVRRVENALGVPSRLMVFPVSWMKFAARLLDSFEFWVLSCLDQRLKNQLKT